MAKYVPITDRSQLSTLGLDAERFVAKTRDNLGGYEWHGPCPVCGGTDRFRVSNGIASCRQCGFGFNVAARMANNGHKLPSNVRITKPAQQVDHERIARVRKFLNSGIIRTLTYNLLASKAALAFVREQWGFGKDVIKKYSIGLDWRFFVYVNNEKRIVPAIVFPHIYGGYVFAATARIAPLTQEGRDVLAVKAFGKYRPWRAMGKASVYPIVRGAKTALIVEGAAKAIAVAESVKWVDVIAVSGVNQLSHNAGGDTVKWLADNYPAIKILFDEPTEQVLTAAVSTAHRLHSVGAHDVAVLQPIGKPDDMLRRGFNLAQHIRSGSVVAHYVAQQNATVAATTATK